MARAGPAKPIHNTIPHSECVTGEELVFVTDFAAKEIPAGECERRCKNREPAREAEGAPGGTRTSASMWLRLINVAVGLWLIAAPLVMDHTGVWRTNDLVVGVMATGVALIAIWVRPVRWINVVLGVWLLLAPLVLERGSTPMGHRMMAGLALLSVALVSRLPPRHVVPR